MNDVFLPISVVLVAFPFTLFEDRVVVSASEDTNIPTLFPRQRLFDTMQLLDDMWMPEEILLWKILFVIT